MDPDRIKTGGLSLLRDTSGNVLPIAAAGLIVMTAIVGAGVDLSRGYKIQNRLQNACDAAVLAGRKAVTTNGYDATAKAQAQTYFDINFDAQQQGTSHTTFLSAGDASGNAIGGQASTQMPMLMMQLFSVGDMTLRASCSSTMGVGNSDITMVLDVTGSMGSALGTGTRISALQTAMKNFYTTVDTATQGSNARVRYSFVPFSTTVNVGKLIYDLDPDYLTDHWTVQSRAPITRTVTSQVFDGWGTAVITSSPSDYTTQADSSVSQYNSTNYASLNTCNSALPANVPWANNGAATVTPSTTTNGAGQQVVTTITRQPQRMTTYICRSKSGGYRRYFYYSNRTLNTYSYATSDPIYHTVTNILFDHWEYKPVQYDTSEFKAFQAVTTPTASNGTNLTSTWEGCIEERQTSAASSISYSALTGMNPSAALDLDIDTAPTGDEATKWAPLWRQVAYNRNTTGVVSSTTNSSTATSYCVPAAKGLQTMTQTAFNNYANALTAQGNTYLDIGLLWGARLSSPEGIFQDTVNAEPANGGNVTRHLIFMTDGFLEPANTTYQSYGIEFLDRRVTSDGSVAQETSRHSLRFRAICDAVKAKGIRIWAIGFTSGLTSDLSYCASPNSSFTANTANELNTAFQTIAKQVGELRVLS